MTTQRNRNGPVCRTGPASGVGKSRGGRSHGRRPLRLLAIAGTALAALAAVPPESSAVDSQIPVPGAELIYVRYGEPGAVRIQRTVARHDTIAPDTSGWSQEAILAIVREELKDLRESRPKHATHRLRDWLEAPASGVFEVDRNTGGDTGGTPQTAPTIVVVPVQPPAAPAPAPTPTAPSPTPSPTARPAPSAPDTFEELRGSRPADGQTPPPPEVPTGGVRTEVTGRIPAGGETAGDAMGRMLSESEVRHALLVTGLLQTGMVHFETAESRILPYSTGTLDMVGRAMVDIPVMRLRITGWTDPRGSEAYNERLSRQRAEAVRRYLLDHHDIDPGRLEARGAGELPMEGSPTLLALARRVDFEVLNPAELPGER